MAAEIIGRYGERLLPALDAFAQRAVYILKRLGGGGVRFSIAIENAAGGDFLVGFVTQEGVFESYLVVAGIEAHGGGELVARGGGLADFQQRVGQVLTYRRAVRREGDGAFEAGDGAVVVLGL